LRSADTLVTPSLAMTSSNRPRWSATWLTKVSSEAEQSTMLRPAERSRSIQPISASSYGSFAMSSATRCATWRFRCALPV
jgi:hypothetical protein